jgi:hypothetical protein
MIYSTFDARSIDDGLLNARGWQYVTIEKVDGVFKLFRRRHEIQEEPKAVHSLQPSSEEGELLSTFTTVISKP